MANTVSVVRKRMLRSVRRLWTLNAAESGEGVDGALETLHQNQGGPNTCWMYAPFVCLVVGNIQLRSDVDVLDEIRRFNGSTCGGSGDLDNPSKFIESETAKRLWNPQWRSISKTPGRKNNDSSIGYAHRDKFTPLSDICCLSIVPGEQETTTMKNVLTERIYNDYVVYACIVHIPRPRHWIAYFRWGDVWKKYDSLGVSSRIQTVDIRDVHPAYVFLRKSVPNDKRSHAD